MNTFHKYLLNKYKKFFIFLEKKDIIFRINKQQILVENHVLICKDDNLDIIPQNTIFFKDLEIHNNQYLTKIEDNVKILGNFSIINTKTINNIVYILNMPNLKPIGNWLYVGGDIRIEARFKFNTLPNNLKCKGSLKLLDKIKLGRNTEVNIFFNELNSMPEIPRNFKTNLLYIGNFRISGFENTKKIKDIYLCSENQYFSKLKYKEILTYETVYLYNYLEFYCPNTLCGKLLNEKFNKINSREIKKYLSNKYYKVGANNKINIINYCRTKNAMEFIMMHNYKFKEDELKNIEEYPYLKILYEKMLFKQNTLGNNVFMNSNKSKKHMLTI